MPTSGWRQDNVPNNLPDALEIAFAAVYVTAMSRRCLTLVTVLAALSLPAVAQTAKPLSQHKDWAAFVIDEQKGKACYIASKPKDSEPKNVRRGEIWVLVTHRPWMQTRNEVSIFTGYPYKQDSTVSVDIDGTKFELFTHEDTAWSKTTDDDGKLVQAMRRGARMVIRGESRRGTKTTDRYSLSGFTAAHKAINAACK